MQIDIVEKLLVARSEPYTILFLLSAAWSGGSAAVSCIAIIVNPE